MSNFNPNKKIKFLPLPYIGMFDLDLIYQTSDVELLYQILSKVNEIAQSQNIIIDNFENILDWAQNQIEQYTKEQLQEWLDDGTIVKLINDYLLETYNYMYKYWMKRYNTTDNIYNDIVTALSQVDTLIIDYDILLPNDSVFNFSNKTLIFKNNCKITTNSITFTGSNNKIIGMNANLTSPDDLITVNGSNNILKNCEIYGNDRKSSFSYTVANIRFNGNYNKIENSECYYGNIGVRLDGNYNEVNSCVIHNCVCGVRISPSSTNCKIYNNKIFDIATWLASHDGQDGILGSIDCVDCIYKGNDIYNCEEHGMYIQSTSSIITNNITHNNNGTGIKLASYTTNNPSYSNSHSIVSNNISHDNNIGFVLQNAAQFTTFDNNTCYNNKTYGLNVSNVDNNLPNTRLIITNNQLDGMNYIQLNGESIISNNNGNNSTLSIGYGNTHSYSNTNNIISNNHVDNIICSGLTNTSIDGNIVNNLHLASGNYSVINNKLINQINDINPRLTTKIDNNEIHLYNSHLIFSQNSSCISISNNIIILEENNENLLTIIENVYSSTNTENINLKVNNNYIKTNVSNNIRPIDLYGNYIMCIGNITIGNRDNYIRGNESVKQNIFINL